MSHLVLLYVTCASEAEAEAIAEALLQQRLIACANILPGMRSLYWWQGNIERGAETVLILKTQASLADAVTIEVKRLHSYTVPCILPLPVGEGGNPDYVAWLDAQTKA